LSEGKLKIAIVHGGASAERVMSTASAVCVKAALARLGHSAYLTDYDKDLVSKLNDGKPDLVWVCVQGKGHGDGTVQAILDFLGLPYTGSGALSAQIINDKTVSKELFRDAGIRTPEWQTLSRADYEAGRFDFSGFGYPFAAKAPTQGDSIGIALIKSVAELGAVAPVFEYDDPVLIERFIPCHFVTSGLLERDGELRVFPAMGVLTENADDRDALILSDCPRPFVRCDFDKGLEDEIADLARRAFCATRARDYARVDFALSLDDGKPYVLEINAVPGLRPTGDALPGYYPLGAAEAGIKYDEFIETIVKSALARNNRGVGPCSRTLR
jgi:D-alanine--D-alanine ligase